MEITSRGEWDFQRRSGMHIIFFSTVVHHLKVQKFEPGLEPVEPVLQVQVRGSGKVVKEPDRTELRQP